MYLYPNSVVYCTLAIGEQYIKKCGALIESVLKFSQSDLYVFTDYPEHYGTWYDKRRIHFIKVDETLTDLPLVYKNEIFNYNLKLVPLKWCHENLSTQLICYLDCDTFLWGNAESTMYRYFEKPGLYARLRHRFCDMEGHDIIKDKVSIMGIDPTDITVRMPVENVMFFKPDNYHHVLFEEWTNMCKLSYEKGATPFYEAVEMTIALHRAKVETFHLDNRHPFTENYRTIHGDRYAYLHSPFVL